MTDNPDRRDPPAEQTAPSSTVATEQARGFAGDLQLILAELTGFRVWKSLDRSLYANRLDEPTEAELAAGALRRLQARDAEAMAEELRRQIRITAHAAITNPELRDSLTI